MQKRFQVFKEHYFNYRDMTEIRIFIEQQFNKLINYLKHVEQTTHIYIFICAKKITLNREWLFASWIPPFQGLLRTGIISLFLAI